MAATDPETSISDNFALNWLPYFSPEGDILPGVTFNVDCQICHKQLAISHPVDENHEPFCVLPCSHAFGTSCIRNWIRASPNATCPSCRAHLWYGCQHYINPRSIRPGVDNIREAISSYIVGRDGLPAQCRRCREPHAPGDNGGVVFPENGDDGRGNPAQRFEVHIGRGDQLQRVQVEANTTVFVDPTGTRPPTFRQGAPRPGQVQVTFIPPPMPSGEAFYGQLPPSVDDVVQGRFPPRRRRSAAASGMPNAPDLRGQSSGRPRPGNNTRDGGQGDGDDGFDLHELEEAIEDEFGDEHMDIDE